MDEAEPVPTRQNKASKAEIVPPLLPSLPSVQKGLLGGHKIPNRIHFCFGLADPPSPFTFAHYLAAKSAFLVNRPDRLTINYAHAPGGEWWERVQQYATLEKMSVRTHIFGRPLHHFAHRAGVFRIRRLIIQGGIYLDMDTLCLRPFTPLLDYECVMAYQNPGGLCDATILAAPDSRFMKIWLNQYRWFRSKGHDEYWDEHATGVPYKLSQLPRVKNSIHLLPRFAFFYPHPTHIERLFEREDITGFKNSYSVHLWESLSGPILFQFTPQRIREGKSAYCQLARQFLTDEE